MVLLKSRRPSKNFPSIPERSAFEEARTSGSDDDVSTSNGDLFKPEGAGPRSRSFFSRRKKAPRANLPPAAPHKSGLMGKTALKLFKRRASAGSEAEIAGDRPLGMPRESMAENVPGGAQNLEGSVLALLASIERGSFDLSDRLSSGDVDSLRALREELQAAKRQCSEKIKRLLHADYPAFIAASKAIREMDGQMQALRAVVQRQQAVLLAVKEVADPSGGVAEAEQEADGSGGWNRPWQDSPEGMRWREALEKLDVAIVEQRASDALPLLKQAERSLLQSYRSGALALIPFPLGGEASYTDAQTAELASRRQKLGDLVTAQILGSPLGSTQMQVATQVLASLSGRVNALHRLLEAHGARLRRAVDQLLKPQNSGSDADGTEFANALGQEVFGAIAAAADDVAGVFGSELKELASVFLVWALGETEKCAQVLKRNALSPFAEPAGLGPTIACCLLPYIHCCGLQASHGLRLSPRLLRDLWPSCDQVLQRRVKRICEDVRGAVASEVSALVRGGASLRGGGGWADLMQIFPSSDLLLDELEAVVKILAPFGSPRVRQALSAAFLRAFSEYTGALAAQFAAQRDADGKLPPALEDGVEAALEVAHAMVEQFLPEVAEPLLAKCGNVCDERRLNAQLVAFETSLAGGVEDDSGRWSGNESAPSTPGYAPERSQQQQNRRAVAKEAQRLWTVESSGASESAEANGPSGDANGNGAAIGNGSAVGHGVISLGNGAAVENGAANGTKKAASERQEQGAWQEIEGFLAAGTDEEVGVALAMVRAYNLKPGPALAALAQEELGEEGPAWTPDEVDDALREVRELLGK